MVAPPQPEMSVCQSWNCGAVFEGLHRHCPTCGNTAVPQKRVRRLGAVQVACGFFLLALMGAVSAYTAPLILAENARPGSEMAGGTGTMILGLYALLLLFGAGAVVSGVYQVRFGRQSWRLLAVLVGIVAVICFGAYAVELGLIG
jgi:MFS family permease